MSTGAAGVAGITDDACKSWTSASSTLAGTPGNPAADSGDSSWTDNGTGTHALVSCNTALHLDCFEK